MLRSIIALSIRTDNGLENVNREVRQILVKKGISHERKVSYIPQLNANAEQEIKSSRGRKNLIKSQGTGQGAMGRNKKMATYTLNKIGKNRVERKTPYQIQKDKDSDIRNFETEVYVRILNEAHLEGDSKTEKEIFVGYGNDIKVYRIYFQYTKCADIKRDEKERGVSAC